MLLSSTPRSVIRKHSFQQIFNIHSPMKKNHSLLEYTRDNDTQVSELGPSGPACFLYIYIYFFLLSFLIFSKPPKAVQQSTPRP